MQRGLGSWGKVYTKMKEIWTELFYLATLAPLVKEVLHMGSVRSLPSAHGFCERFATVKRP